MAAETTLFLLRLGFFLVLYSFLGVLLLVVWRDLRAAAEQPTSKRRKTHAPGYLRVVNQGTTTFAAGDLLPLQPVTAAGRELSNDIVLSDSFASANHALFTYRQGCWWLEDLGSRNGTTVNGSRIQRPVPLDLGDIVGIGQVLLKLE